MTWTLSFKGYECQICTSSSQFMLCLDWHPNDSYSIIRNSYLVSVLLTKGCWGRAVHRQKVVQQVAYFRPVNCFFILKYSKLLELSFMQMLVDELKSSLFIVTILPISSWQIMLLLYKKTWMWVSTCCLIIVYRQCSIDWLTVIDTLDC